MKKYIYTLVLGLMLSACTADKKQTIISVLEDVTEADFLVTPHMSTILPQFHLDKDKWQAVEFRYGSISSLIHNKRVSYKLMSENALFANDIERKAKIKQFKQDVSEALKKNTYTEAHRYSAIWTPLMDEIRALQNIPKSNATLYLYSDLQENNSSWFSIHKYNDLMLLERNTQKVAERFLSETEGIKKGNKNITVIVVYQPRTMKEDIAFSKMKKLYTIVFKELGISIAFITKLQ